MFKNKLCLIYSDFLHFLSHILKLKNVIINL